MSRIPNYLENRLIDGDEVVSLTKTTTTTIIIIIIIIIINFIT
jgi:hypothetical protein